MTTKQDRKAAALAAAANLGATSAATAAKIAEHQAFYAERRAARAPIRQPMPAYPSTGVYPLDDLHADLLERRRFDEQASYGTSQLGGL